MSYDNAGNLYTDENGYIYSYDYENRLVKINDGSYDIVTYDYDALGRRIRTTDMSGENDIVTTYYYNDDWQVIGEYKTGHPLCSYYYGNDRDEVIMRYYTDGGMFSGMITYYLDHLHSPVAVIDQTGSIVERYEYSAYGRADIFTAGADGTYFTADDVHDLTVSTVDNPISFTGRELDVLDSGSLRIMYYRNRYYTPTHGRFLTKDPLGVSPYAKMGNETFSAMLQYSDGVNVYAYVGNDPVNNRDVLGLSMDEYWKGFLGTKQCYNIVGMPGLTAFTETSIRICIQGDVFGCCSSEGRKTCIKIELTFDIGQSVRGTSKIGGPVKGGSQPGIKDWLNPISLGKLKNKFGGSLNVPFRHGYSNKRCPKEGIGGKACFTASAGFGYWSVGYRGCLGSDGYTWEAGMGVGQSTGVAFGGAATWTGCWR